MLDKKITEINSLEKTKFWLAPMAGISDFAFRKLCMEYGAGGTVSEMISAKGLYYGDKNTELLMPTKDDLRPVALQIFGSDPRIMALVVRDILNHRDFDFLDINMGCPVPKIVKNGEGSALMKNPSLAFDIVSEIKKVSNKPVSVKIRKGFYDNEPNAPYFAKVLENAGADLITVHGRTREQYYKPSADWDIIAEVKANVKIPVYANGDIVSPESAKAILEHTGCDGAMIGRAAMGKPWLFKQVREYLETGSYSDDLDVPERVALIKRQLELMLKYKPERIAICEMRKHCSYYLKGFNGSNAYRNALNTINDLNEWYQMLDEIALKN